MTKNDFLQFIRQYIVQGKTEEAVALMRQQIGQFDPSLVNDATMLESRYQRVKEDFLIKNIVQRDDYDRTVAQINYAILETLQKLEGTPTFMPAAARSNTGKLLHSIAGVMPVRKETRCIIRIAYDEETVRRDLPATADVVVQPVRISKVMSVDLIDCAETPNFQIRPITDGEQLVDDDDYTQWIFMVKPLREGKFPITIKVAVIEEVNGKERRRDIVLEKDVFIIADGEPAPGAGEGAQSKVGAVWQDTNIRLEQKTATDRTTGVMTDSAPPPAPGSPAAPSSSAPPPAPSYELPPPPMDEPVKKRGLSMIATLVAAVVLAITGSVIYNNMPTAPNVSTARSTASSGRERPMDSISPSKPTEPVSTAKEEVAVMIPENNPNIDALKKEALPSANTFPESTGSEGARKAGDRKNAPVAVVKRPNDIIVGPQKKPVLRHIDTLKSVTKTTPVAAEKTYNVRLVMRGEMADAEILVDGKPAQIASKSGGGLFSNKVTKVIAISQRDPHHRITFRTKDGACTTDVVVDRENLEVDACRFKVDN